MSPLAEGHGLVELVCPLVQLDVSLEQVQGQGSQPGTAQCDQYQRQTEQND